MTQYDRLITQGKEYLPIKAKKDAEFPVIIWIEPPTHDLFRDNAFRREFGHALAKNMQYHDKHYSVQMLKAWDPRDHSYVDVKEKKLTNIGYQKYWESVDKAVKYIDTILMKKEEMKKQKQSVKNQQQRYQRDKFHWNEFQQRTVQRK